MTNSGRRILIQITFDVMNVRKPLLSTSALKRRGVTIIFNHDYDRIIFRPFYSSLAFTCSFFFLLHPRQTPMGRRGWKSFDAPTGWVQDIHGPRPPSVQWPRVGQQQVRQSVTGRVAAPSKPEPRQLLANHHTQLQHQPKPGSKTSGLRPFTDPAAKVSDAKERCGQVGESIGSHGGYRWFRGRLYPGGSGTCQKGSSKLHRSRHRSEIANNFWSELEHIWRQSMPRELRWWPVSRRVPRDWNL